MDSLKQQMKKMNEKIEQMNPQIIKNQKEAETQALEERLQQKLDEQAARFEERLTKQDEQIKTNETVMRSLILSQERMCKMIQNTQQQNSEIMRSIQQQNEENSAFRAQIVQLNQRTNTPPSPTQSPPSHRSLSSEANKKKRIYSPSKSVNPNICQENPIICQDSSWDSEEDDNTVLATQLFPSTNPEKINHPHIQEAPPRK